MINWKVKENNGFWESHNTLKTPRLLLMGNGTLILSKSTYLVITLQWEPSLFSSNWWGSKIKLNTLLLYYFLCSFSFKVMESLPIFKNIPHSKHSKRITLIGLDNLLIVIIKKLTDLTWLKIMSIMETGSKPFGTKDLKENTKNFHFILLERHSKKLL